MKIVINACHGGFSLSDDAIIRYAETKGFVLYAKPIERFGIDMGVQFYTSPDFNDESYFSDRDIERNDLVLIQVVEEMKESANGDHASLKVVTIPDGVEYTIQDYDGREHIAEKHRTWS